MGLLRLDSHEFFELLNEIVDEALLDEFPALFLDDVSGEYTEGEAIELYREIMDKLSELVEDEVERRMKVDEEKAREFVYQIIKDIKDD